MAFGGGRSTRRPDSYGASNSRSLATRLAVRGEERFTENPRPVGEVVASLSTQQQKLQGLEKKLRRLQHRSPSPRSRSSAFALRAAAPDSPRSRPSAFALRAAAPDFSRTTAALPMDSAGLSGGEQGNLAAFLESVSSRIDALDHKLRNMAEPTPASDPRIEVYRDTDTPWLSRGAVSRGVRRALSADGFGTRRLLARPERMLPESWLAEPRAVPVAPPAVPSAIPGAETTIQQLVAAATAAAEAARTLARWSPSPGNQFSQAPQELPPPAAEFGSRSGSFLEADTLGVGRAHDVRTALQNGMLASSSTSTPAVNWATPQLQALAMSSNAPPPSQYVAEQQRPSSPRPLGEQRRPLSPRPSYSSTADGFSQRVNITPTLALGPSGGGQALSAQQEFQHFSQPSAWEMSSRPMAATGFASMGPALGMTSFPSSGPPAPLATRSNRDASNGMFVFNQAEGQAFRELGEKAPQPKDGMVLFEGAPPTSASPMFPMSPTAEIIDASLAFQQAPGQGFPPTSMTMLASSNGTSRPLSAGPSARSGRYGAVYQGAPGPLGLELRERERDNLPQGEHLYRPPSSWSSRPPTWYDGASDASLSAPPTQRMQQPMQLTGGMFGGSNEGFNAAIWRPADRVDNFPSESFLDKVK